MKLPSWCDLANFNIRFVNGFATVRWHFRAGDVARGAEAVTV
jgi:hypothetical protein